MAILYHIQQKKGGGGGGQKKGEKNECRGSQCSELSGNFLPKGRKPAIVENGHVQSMALSPGS